MVTPLFFYIQVPAGNGIEPKRPYLSIMIEHVDFVNITLVDAVELGLEQLAAAMFSGLFQNGREGLDMTVFGHLQHLVLGDVATFPWASADNAHQQWKQHQAAKKGQAQPKAIHEHHVDLLHAGRAEKWAISSCVLETSIMDIAQLNKTGLIQSQKAPRIRPVSVY